MQATQPGWFFIDWGQLTSKTVSEKDSYSDKISQETFQYDGIQRMTKHATTYDIANSKSVGGEIVYQKGVTDPTADNRVYSDTCMVNGSQRAKTVNGYDSSLGTRMLRMMTQGG